MTKQQSFLVKYSLFLKGTGSRFSARPFIKMLFFCLDMLYHLRKQYDHVIMLQKTNLHTPLSPLAVTCT